MKYKTDVKEKTVNVELNSSEIFILQNATAILQKIDEQIITRLSHTRFNTNYDESFLCIDGSEFDYEAFATCMEIVAGMVEDKDLLIYWNPDENADEEDEI